MSKTNVQVNNCTMKKAAVLPDSSVPYCMSVCLAKSSADSIGVNIRSTVKNAARFAVYELIMISVKNHQTLPTIRPDIDLTKEKTEYRILSI